MSGRVRAILVACAVLLAAMIAYGATAGGTQVAATCYGSDNCRACSTCGYCGHCAERGGTCGVCSTSGFSFSDGDSRDSDSDTGGSSGWLLVVVAIAGACGIGYWLGRGEKKDVKELGGRK